MTFCTAINCMDGRVQAPVAEYLKKRFAADFVDMITEAGPNAILARRIESALVESILRRTRISVENHGSVGIAVVGHANCAGNRVGPAQQAADTLDAARYIREIFPAIPVIALWVNERRKVDELTTSLNKGSARPMRRRPSPSRIPRRD